MSTAINRQPLQHEQIKQRLKQRIGRDWKPGDRLPPISQLADEMGVGENNTFRAVRELRREGILASRPRLGTIVTARPEAVQRKPTVQRRVHLPLGTDQDGMVQRVVTSFTESVRRQGHEVMKGPALGGAGTDLSKIDADAVGLINEGRLRHCRPGPEQMLVIVDTSGEEPRMISSGYDLVGPDQRQGGMLAGEHLREIGVRSPAFVGVTDENGSYRSPDALRLAGFEAGFGKPIDPSRKISCEAYTELAGGCAALAFSKLDNRPDAVFCSTDEIAIGFIIGAKVLGMEVGRDYRLVGFDGLSRAQGIVWGGMTTVVVPAEAMGRQAGELLVERFDAPADPPRSVRLGCTLHVGRTTSGESSGA